MRKQFTLDELMTNTIDTQNGCKEWTKARTRAGYSQKWDGEKVSYVHRIVCEIVNGPMDGLEVLHECDNPPCINPEHLSWGTRRENVADMIRKGRARLNPQRGEKHGMAKLTKDQVRRMRVERKKGALLREIAEKYGVTISSAHLVVTKKQWKEI